MTPVTTYSPPDFVIFAFINPVALSFGVKSYLGQESALRRGNKGASNTVRAFALPQVQHCHILYPAPAGSRGPTAPPPVSPECGAPVTIGTNAGNIRLQMKPTYGTRTSRGLGTGDIGRWRNKVSLWAPAPLHVPCSPRAGQINQEPSPQCQPQSLPASSHTRRNSPMFLA